MRKVLASLLILLVATNPVLAWNDLGHKIVASIAWRQLNNDERDKVVALLSKHPRFVEDFQGRMPDSIAAGSLATKNEWLVQQAAVWPDIARGFTETVSWIVFREPKVISTSLFQAIFGSHSQSARGIQAVGRRFVLDLEVAF